MQAPVTFPRVTPLGLSPATIRSMQTAQAQARTDMHSAPMPYTRDAARRAYALLTSRIVAELTGRKA